jgi:hypothetical protein
MVRLVLSRLNKPWRTLSKANRDSRPSNAESFSKSRSLKGGGTMERSHWLYIGRSAAGALH